MSDPTEAEEATETHEEAAADTAATSGATTDEDVPILAHVDEYLKLGQEYDCSDIHLATASPPMWRRYGVLQPIWPNAKLITADDADRLIKGFLGARELKRYEEKGDVDFAYATDFGRFRASVVKQRLGSDMVFRIIKTEVQTM